MIIPWMVCDSHPLNQLFSSYALSDGSLWSGITSTSCVLILGISHRTSTTCARASTISTFALFGNSTISFSNCAWKSGLIFELQYIWCQLITGSRL